MDPEPRETLFKLIRLVYGMAEPTLYEAELLSFYDCLLAKHN